MKKIPKFSEAAWVCGLFLCGLGVALTVKADFGVSMVEAPAYILYLKLSQYFSWYTLGTSEYLFQGLLLGLLCAGTQRLRFRFLLSFVTAVIYGKILDLWLWILGGSTPYTGMGVRVIAFAAGIAITSLSIAFFFRTYLPLQIYELFVSETADRFSRKTETVKYIYDASCLVLSFILTLLLNRHLEGIGAGTVVCTTVNTPLIALCGKLLDRCIDFSPASPKTKEKYLRR